MYNTHITLHCNLYYIIAVVNIALHYLILYSNILHFSCCIRVCQDSANGYRCSVFPFLSTSVVPAAPRCTMKASKQMMINKPTLNRDAQRSEKYKFQGKTIGKSRLLTWFCIFLENTLSAFTGTCSEPQTVSNYIRGSPQCSCHQLATNFCLSLHNLGWASRRKGFPVYICLDSIIVHLVNVEYRSLFCYQQQRPSVSISCHGSGP